MNLPFPVLLGIEKAIEAVLRLDEPTRTRLAELDGKTIQVNLSSPNLSLLLSVVGSAVHLSQAEPDTGEVMGITADATISGSLSALRSLIDGNDAIYTGKVTLEGDIGVGQSLKQLLAQLDPDWQDAVSPVLGDGLTHRLDMAQTGFFAWLGRTRTAASSNTSEYLHPGRVVSGRHESPIFQISVRSITDSMDEQRDTCTAPGKAYSSGSGRVGTDFCQAGTGAVNAARFSTRRHRRRADAATGQSKAVLQRTCPSTNRKYLKRHG